VFSGLLQLNYALFQEINAPAGSHPWFDALMIFCANSLIFFFPLLLLMVWGRPVNWRKRAIFPGDAELLQERRALVLWVALACLLAFGLNLLIEQFVFEPRPFISHKVHLLVSRAADASFPSDHAAWSFAVVGMLLLILLPPFITAWRKRADKSALAAKEFKRAPQAPLRALRVPFLLTLAALVVACSIGLARIYVGVHYPGDILGGAIDGLVAACIVTALRRWLRQPTNAVIRFAQTLRLA
jgi:undecaprenyl-diphosphatase